MKLSLSIQLHLLLGFLAWLQPFAAVYAMNGDSGCGTFMCINATLHGDMVTYDMTVLREPLGWIAIGFGRKMQDTHMVIMWPNDDGTTTISQRYGTGHREPIPVSDPPRLAKAVTPRITSWHPTNSTTLSFQIPANKTLLQSLQPAERMIWAYSKHRPLKFPSAVLKPHYISGFFRLDLSKTLPDNQEFSHLPPPSEEPQTPSKEQTAHEEDIHLHHDESSSDPTDMVVESKNQTGPFGNHEKLIITHGVLLSVGFILLLPAGSLMARWGRTMTPKWFRAHQASNMLLALPIITIGFLLGPLSVFSHQAAHLVDAHQTCGVILVFLYYLQVFLGRYIHRRRVEKLVPANRPHPPSNILHVTLGLSIICLAFFQVRSGMDEWEIVTARPPVALWLRDLWLAWIVLVPIAYLAGFVLLPRQFFQERQGISYGSENYIALSDGANSPTSRLLYDVPEEDPQVTEVSSRLSHPTTSMETINMVAERR